MIHGIVPRHSWTLLLLLPILNAQQSTEAFQKLLPVGAKIIETVDLTPVVGKPRAMVLWMMRPKRHSGGPEYCGTDVHGDYWDGPTRLSLVDSELPRLINNVVILGRGPDGLGKADKFQVPFLVSNSYYHVPHLGGRKTGPPEILHLQDFTGEGVRTHFVLFMYDACGIVSTGVLGYQQRSDRVMQYPIEVHDRDGKHVELWIEQVFATKPVRPGRWSFTWRPAHGTDDILHEEVSFDQTKQMFVERQTVSLPSPGRRK
jgi:hypothetical protein